MLRTFLLIITLHSFFGVFSQERPENNFDCHNTILKNIKVENIVVKYKLLEVSKLYTKGQTDYYVAHCILPEYDSKSDKKIIQRIVNEICKQNIKINELAIFKDFEAENIYYQALYPTKEQQKFFKRNFIGNYKPKK